MPRNCLSVMNESVIWDMVNETIQVGLLAKEKRGNLCQGQKIQE